MVRAWIPSIAALFRRLARATHGGVALIGGLSLTTVVGMGAFAVEAGQGYSAKVSDQRIADMAALAGALAYNVNNNSTEMTASAKAVAVAQGLTASQAAVALVTDAPSGKQLVQVTITSSVPLSLGRVFTSALSYDVSAVGSASTSTTTTTTPPCISAINGTPTNGISLSGGTALNASGCAINSNAGFSLVGGTTITAGQINSAKSVSVSGGSSITTAPTSNNIVQNKAGAASDWMSNDTGLLALLCKVNQLSGYTDPDYPDGNRTCTTPLVAPTVATGAAWNLNYHPAANVAPYRVGSSANYVVPPGTYNMTSLALAGGITATFQGPVNLVIGTINMGGTALHVGNGNISVSGAITTGGGAVVDFDVGTGNTVSIGAAGVGTAINVGNGTVLCFTAWSTAGCAAPTAAAGTFSVGGSIVTGGGSTVVFPKAMVHVINGNLTTSGAVNFGSGSYYINGNFTNSTGGALTGVDVTFGLAGTYSLAGGTSLDLAAPTATSSYGVPGILFATKTSSATTLGGGAVGKYAGLVYAPKSAVTLSGGASMSANGSACLMMIVSTLSLTGGTSVASQCGNFSSISTTTNTVSLFK